MELGLISNDFSFIKTDATEEFLSPPTYGTYRHTANKSYRRSRNGPLNKTGRRGRPPLKSKRNACTIFEDCKFTETSAKVSNFCVACSRQLELPSETAARPVASPRKINDRFFDREKVDFSRTRDRLTETKRDAAVRKNLPSQANYRRKPGRKRVRDEPAEPLEQHRKSDRENRVSRRFRKTKSRRSAVKIVENEKTELPAPARISSETEEISDDVERLRASAPRSPNAGRRPEASRDSAKDDVSVEPEMSVRRSSDVQLIFAESQKTNFDAIHKLPLAERFVDGGREGKENQRPSREEFSRLTEINDKIKESDETEVSPGAKKSRKSERNPRKSDERKNPETAAAAAPKIARKDEEFGDVRRVTRGSRKISKENFVGKLVWGYCSGWWPALIIDAEHVGMLPEERKLWVYWIGEARISLLNEKTQIESFSSNLKYRLEQNANLVRARAVDVTIQMLRDRLGCTLTKPYFSWIEKNFYETNEPLDEINFYPYPRKIQQRLDHLKAINAKITEKFLSDQKRSPNQGKRNIEKSRESSQQTETDQTHLTLREQHPGVITWAKIAGHNWWPAMIIDYRDCCMREPSFGCQWIMWYGDYKLSEIHHQLFIKFDKGIEKMRDYVNRTKKHAFLAGVLQASKDYCSRLGCQTDNWSLPDVFKYFAGIDGDSCVQNVAVNFRESARIYDKYSVHIIGKLKELINNPNIDDERQDDIKNSEDLRSVTQGIVALEMFCVKCLKVSKEIEVHPFFEGSLCKSCSKQFKPRMFVFGNDGKCFYCTVCAGSGTVIICDKDDCPRVYCTACMKHLLCPKAYDDVLLEDPWECFLCKHDSPLLSDMIIKPRPNWKDKIIDMFRTTSNPNLGTVKEYQNKRKIRVLSLFDGLSTGLLVLLKLGLTVDVYYASEIDKDALMVSTSHFGDRIVHLGNVKGITMKMIKEMAPIDLLIGGSPCNDLSLANPARLGLHDPKGTGILFFEYCRIMRLIEKANEGHHLFWLYENVASMPTEYRLEMNKHLGQEPDVIDSADFSPQHRLRLYWHNLPIEPHSLSLRRDQDVQDIQDILTPHCQRYALVKKIRTVTTKVNSLKQGKSALKPILMKDQTDSLWITELEEIFGFPRHYTDVKNLSATNRQKLIGKSWSVQTLSAILQSLCAFFECSTEN